MNSNRVIKVKDDLGNSFLMHYGGSDLYWTMTDYKEDYSFVFNKENIVYGFLDRMFNNLNINDKFEWISEAYGIEECAHKLIIIKEDEQYIIKFIQNELNMYRIKDLCPICFCLSGSRDQNVIFEVTDMFYNLGLLEEKEDLKRSLNKCSF